MFPLTFRDKGGNPATLEDLIVRHERKELLETPVMLDLIERKWLYFAGDLYRRRFLAFAAMGLSVFLVSAAPTGSALFDAAAVRPVRSLSGPCPVPAACRARRCVYATVHRTRSTSRYLSDSNHAENDVRTNIMSAAPR